jgi:two-component system, chemotaxis family, protein-glutamate methylesterase/glutaminase
LNAHRPKRNIVVIGASAGGFDAIKELVAALPRDLDAAVFIVWHMSPELKAILPHVLNRNSRLPVSNAYDKCPIKKGHIYIAVPDHHLLISEREMYVTKGPKENHFRPAVDPLFRSAALAFGSCVIGIILSGALDDGAAGLKFIKANGGVTIVQDPSTAEVPSMPENAIRAAKPDHIIPVSAMAALLRRITEETLFTLNA